MMIVPTLFFRIANAMTKENVGKTAIKTIAIFIAMFTATFFITALIVSIVQPGAGAQFTNVDWNGKPATMSLSGFFIGLVPQNILAAAADN